MQVIFCRRFAGFICLYLLPGFLLGAYGDDGEASASSGPAVPAASREERFATDELRRTIAPLLIPRTRDAAGAPAAAGMLPRQDPVNTMMYEGMDLVLDEEYEQAIPLLEAVLEAEPTMIPVWSTLGWTYWKVGRQADAVALWKRLLALDPDHPTSHLLMGNAYVGTGRLQDAEYHLKRSIALDSHQIEPRLVLSTLYRWTGRHEASVAELRGLLAEHPDRMDIQNQLGISLYESGHYEEALPLLEKGVRAVPDDTELARAHIRCLLRTGSLSQAQVQARRLLRDDEPNVELLLLLADAPRYQNHPADALPYLRRIIRETDDERILTEAHLRLIEISVQIWEREPWRYTLDEAISSSAALLDMDPENPAWRQSYGELLLRDRRYTAAARAFETVLAYSTTNVLAARNGLFEAGQALNHYAMGRRHLDFITGINPSNPYLHQMRARLELSRGNLTAAYDALDRLEAAGSRGAVAVLHYGKLSDSDWDDVLSVRRFRLQMLTLKQAGYRFLTPAKIAEYFAALETPASRLEDRVPEKAVVVTFDHADARTLKLATQVASDLDLVFALHVAAGPVDEGLSGTPGIETLREYRDSGRWVFGSMLYDAITQRPVRPDGRQGSLLANRMWLTGDEMYEPDGDYARRLRKEYRVSRQRIREWLGENEPVGFVAYPYGEFGQGLLSNVDDAIERNMTEAAINYEIGFIQSVFGYAVNGDNPLMYQRYSPGAFDSGEDLLDHLAEHHPMFLARRMRAELAALDGRLYRARANLKRLQRDGYPERPYDRIESFVYKHLALKFGIARQTEKAGKQQFAFDPDSPYGGTQLNWFRDSLGRRNWRNAWHAGFYLTPAIHADVRAGMGDYRQRFSVNLAAPDETPVLERRNASVTETFVGARIGMRYDPPRSRRSPIAFSAGLERHEYREDADFNDWSYMLETAFRPVVYADVLLRFDHDATPSARSMTEGLAYDQYSYAGNIRMRDWWDFGNRVTFYDFDDGNERVHVDLSCMWELVESLGILAGGEYAYVTARHPKIDYWTPFKMHQWMLALRLRDNYYRFYYDIAAKYGFARESVRTEDLAAYLLLAERGREFSFDPGDPPRSEWIEVFSVSAALRTNLGRYFQAYVEGLYNESINYHEYQAIAGLSLMF